MAKATTEKSPTRRRPVAKQGVRRATAKANPKQNEIDFVNRPPHYTKGKIETIDKIKDSMTPEEFRGFCKGNLIKYVWRERRKGGNESLEKAQWYVNRLLEGVKP